ncbi:MAG: phosphoglucosamine mutase [Desulfobacterales bacterium]|jgi:phosphoglucosamine mutase|nr:phosphoglucosamine mutase [Desulfobacterales bacterium]
MGRLFGTDGIRGVANEYPLTAEAVFGIGRAVASFFGSSAHPAKIIIGKDTRESGDMIEDALASGICSVGADASLAGILPTPAVAHLVSSNDAAAGIVISASHNPFGDNGIKIFDADGYKLSDAKEDEIECLLPAHNIDLAPGKFNHRIGNVETMRDAPERYLAFLQNTLPDAKLFNDMKIVLDCSNGATYAVAPKLFQDLGAQVEALHIRPDGKNINADCGSEHPETLIEAVLAQNADIGLAFDGDGDRLVAVDEKGQIISGDRTLVICARSLKRKGLLKNNLVVSTVMSNLGLRLALKDLGINHIMAQVGDRYVLQQMNANGAVIGGEDSGHMIFLDQHTTGDGMLTAIRLIQTMCEEKKPLSELSRVMTVFPQVLLNIDVQKKPLIEEVPQIMAVIRSVEECLGEKGRVLVRYSGTQPLCRVMVEGPEKDETRRYCQQIADVVKATLS